jgi:hypothetical protein
MTRLVRHIVFGRPRTATTTLTPSGASSDDVDMLALCVCHTFGETELLIPESTQDTSKARMFMKEIFFDGNVNNIDVIFPSTRSSGYPIQSTSAW